MNATDPVSTEPSIGTPFGSATVRGLSDWSPEVQALMQVLCREPHFGGNRRRCDRKRYHVEATVTHADEGQNQRTIPVFTRNISAGYVAFICGCVVRVGQTVSMTFPLPGGGVRTATGTVRRCRQFYEGWFDCVVRFETPPKQTRRRWSWFGRGQGQS